MKKIGLLFTLVLCSVTMMSQKSRKFSVQISHGVTGNFFVRSYDELGGPPNKQYFYKKDFIGSISGINAEYRFSPASSIVADFFKSTNLGRKNFERNLNGVELSISDFRLRHLNRILSMGYGYQIKRSKSFFKLDAGFTFVYDVQQIISLEDWDSILIAESNYKNSNTVEGGVFFGASWAVKIDTRFDLGVKARIYYLISTSSLEAISLSPTLTYHF